MGRLVLLLLHSLHMIVPKEIVTYKKRGELDYYVHFNRLDVCCRFYDQCCSPTSSFIISKLNEKCTQEIETKKNKKEKKKNRKKMKEKKKNNKKKRIFC